MTSALGGAHPGTAGGLRLTVALPLLLLLTMAGVHATLRHTTELTPWKGGGFAMFSSIDGPAVRQVRMSVRTANGTWIDALPPNGYGEDIDLLRTISSRGRTEGLADRAATESWFSAGGPAFASDVVGGPVPGLSALPVTAVRVEVLHPEFDAATGRLALRTVHDVVVERPGGRAS